MVKWLKLVKLSKFNFFSMPDRIIYWRPVLALIFLLNSSLFAQDIEPRRWNNLPLGTQVAGLGYAYSFGDVFFDPLLQAEDVDVRVHSLVAAFVHPFRIGKRPARVDLLLPFSFARWEGLLSGEPASAERNGMADPRIRLSYHITGPPPMNPKEMREYLAQHAKYTTFGVSLAVSLPLGQYNDERLLNLGLNQFVFRPQIGLLHNWGLWSFELTASVFLFTDNNDFFNDGNKRQDPLFAAQAHLIKRFKSRSWVSVSTGFGQGGQSVVNRQPNDDVRANFLASASYGYPLGPKQSLKFTYIRSETLKDIGADTNNLILGWTFAF